MEFDSDGITMRPENGGDDAGGADGGDADDLGGVVMPHDEMVAADREQELPEASQPSVAVVEIMVGVCLKMFERSYRKNWKRKEPLGIAVQL